LSLLNTFVDFLKGEQPMKKIMVFVLATIMVMGLAISAQAVNVEIYSGYGTTGGGAPYSDLVGSFLSDDIEFATDTGYNWHPFGLSDFGARLTGCLIAGADGTYIFGLDSDDGSLLFIDGSLVVDNGGAHPPQIAYDQVNLTAGIHPFEVQFYEDFGGPSGVDLILGSPGNCIRYCPIPLPPSVWLMGSGLLGLVGWRRFRKV
jgi:PA14 domain